MHLVSQTPSTNHCGPKERKGKFYKDRRLGMANNGIVMEPDVPRQCIFVGNLLELKGYEKNCAGCSRIRYAYPGVIWYLCQCVRMF